MSDISHDTRAKNWLRLQLLCVACSSDRPTAHLNRPLVSKPHWLNGIIGENNCPKNQSLSIRFSTPDGCYRSRL